jgi:hypothetical protein
MKNGCIGRLILHGACRFAPTHLYNRRMIESSGRGMFVIPPLLKLVVAGFLLLGE